MAMAYQTSIRTFVSPSLSSTQGNGPGSEGAETIETSFIDAKELRNVLGAQGLVVSQAEADAILASMFSSPRKGSPKVPEEEEEWENDWG